MSGKNQANLGLFLLVMCLLALSFSSVVYAYDYELKGTVDNSNLVPPSLNLSAYYEAGQRFFFNFTKGRFWGVQYDTEKGGLEPAWQNFAPNASLPPYKVVTFDVYTPSNDTLPVDVYAAGGSVPLAVVYFNQSADFVPLPGGNLTFVNVGIEGMIERTGNYTVKAISVVPPVYRDANHTYDITGDPPILMSLWVETGEIPEFSPPTMLWPLAIATVVVAIAYKRKRPRSHAIN